MSVAPGANSFIVSTQAAGLFPGGHRIVPITTAGSTGILRSTASRGGSPGTTLRGGVNTTLPGFGTTFGPRGIPQAVMASVADRSARRLAQMMLDRLRPITPVDTGALRGSLALMQIATGSWAVTYGPFYGFFQFFGTRYIKGLKDELVSITNEVVLKSGIVIAEELAAESVGL